MTARVWELEEGGAALRGVLKGHRSTVQALALVRDARRRARS